MKKLTLTFIITVFCIPLIFVPTTVLSGGHEPKEWKGEGTKIEFQQEPGRRL